MSGSHIGIKVADGSLYPIFEKSAQGKKRLILTTAHQNQQTVQVSLYQGDDSSTAEYIGTLMVENIAPSGQGEAEISLVLGIDASGNLNATATDLGSGEYQSLSVSLQSLDEQNLYDMPDFSLEEEEGEAFVAPIDDSDEFDDGETSDDSDASLDLSPDAEETEADPQAAPQSVPQAEPDELALDDEFDLDGLDSLDLDSAELDSLDSLDTLAESEAEEEVAQEIVEDDDFTFDTGEEVDAAWQAALDADERRFADEEAVDDAVVDLEPGDAEAEDEAGFSATEGPDEAGLGELDDLGADSDFELSDLGDLDEYDFAETDRPDSRLAPDAGDQQDLSGDFEPDSEWAQSAASRPGASQSAAAESGRPARMGFTADFDAEPSRGAANVVLFFGFVILALAALGFLTYIIFRAIESPAVPPIEAGIGLLLPFKARCAALLRGPFSRRRHPR